MTKRIKASELEAGDVYLQLNDRGEKIAITLSYVDHTGTWEGTSEYGTPRTGTFHPEALVEVRNR